MAVAQSMARDRGTDISRCFERGMKVVSRASLVSAALQLPYGVVHLHLRYITSASAAVHHGCSAPSVEFNIHACRSEVCNERNRDNTKGSVYGPNARC